MSAEVFTDDEIAARWGVGIQVVQKMLREGRLRGFKCGHAWRVTAANVDLYEQGEKAAS